MEREEKKKKKKRIRELEGKRKEDNKLVEAGGIKGKGFVFRKKELLYTIIKIKL